MLFYVVFAVYFSHLFCICSLPVYCFVLVSFLSSHFFLFLCIKLIHSFLEYVQLETAYNP